MSPTEDVRSGVHLLVSEAEKGQKSAFTPTSSAFSVTTDIDDFDRSNISPDSSHEIAAQPTDG